jgi:ribosomal protein S6--L-glutamate ligase
LRENDVNVLTLYRGTSVVPNPRSDRILEAGDRLLCFGRLEAMKSMIPKKTRKRRAPAIQHLHTSDVAHIDAEIEV